MTDEQLRQIHAWWQVFQHGGELTEIRIVGKYTDSGYYKDINNLIRDVEANEHKGAVYFTINPPKEACYGRKQQEQMPTGGGKMATTQDADVASRRFVLLDLDCVTGVSDVNSTDEEKTYALAKCRDIFRYLRKEGFNDGIVNDSANGYHIFLPCELENTEENTKPSFHEKIRIASVREYDYDEVSKEIDELVEISKQFDNMATVRKMKEIVPEYKSNNSVYEVLDEKDIYLRE